MADEAKVTPDTEVKPINEGSVETIVTPEVAPKDESTHAGPDTVPLKVYLELKQDLKDLKQEIKDSSANQRSDVKIAGLEDLAKKYPDVNEEFIKDILSSSTDEATRRIEAKYSPIIEKQDAEKKQVAFDKAFDSLFDKTLQDNPDLPKNIDKELIKELATTPKYRNTPLAEILVKMYGSAAPQGRSTSENEQRSGADVVDDVVSFDKITPEQKTRIMGDEKTRKAYFNWLDTQN